MMEVFNLKEFNLVLIKTIMPQDGFFKVDYITCPCYHYLTVEFILF